VSQRGKKGGIEGAVELSVWCDGREKWEAEVEPDGGAFKPGPATVSVHAYAHMGAQTGQDDESERVHLERKHRKDKRCGSEGDFRARGLRCRD
jgi:hypothetical protein